MTLILRQAYPEDLEQLTTILRANYEGETLNLGCIELGEYLRNPLVKILALGDPEIVGFVGYAQSYMDWDSYELFWLNVSPTAQGKGYGAVLVKAALSEVDLKGERSFLWTNKQDFWSKYGFREFLPNMMVRERP